MRYTLFSILSIVALSGCNHAKREALETRKTEQIENYRRQLADEERTCVVTDSLLQALLPLINEASAKGFVFEKTEYDDLGRYYQDGTQPVNHIGRSYVRALVDEYGVTQLISTYAGGTNIDHSALKVSASDGTSCQTLTVDYNDGSNYRYKNNGTHYESVTYWGGTGNATLQEAKDRNNGSLRFDTDAGALAFIALHADDKALKSFLITPKREYPVLISAKERQQMRATYELGKLLQERMLLEQQNKTASLKVRYLKERLASKQLESQEKK